MAYQPAILRLERMEFSDDPSRPIRSRRRDAHALSVPLAEASETNAAVGKPPSFAGIGAILSQHVSAAPAGSVEGNP